MRHFRLVARGLDVAPLTEELRRAPQLWDQHPERRADVHAEMTDIWIRYRARHELREPKHYREPHIPVFYPAWQLLPSLHPLVYDLMRVVEAVQLGAILITRIPPGGQILPHDDRGSWHAEFMNCKLYVPLATNPDVVNLCGHDRVHMRVGEAWTFNNLLTHSVENNGDSERITLIICMRVESGRFM